MYVDGDGGGWGLEWGWGLNKEAAVQELPGLGIKEGAAISNTFTLQMKAQQNYNYCTTSRFKTQTPRPGLGIKEGAAISNTFTPEMKKAQLLQHLKISKLKHQDNRAG